jgi:hypothetical protein
MRRPSLILLSTGLALALSACSTDSNSQTDETGGEAATTGESSTNNGDSAAGTDGGTPGGESGVGSGGEPGGGTTTAGSTVGSTRSQDFFRAEPYDRIVIELDTAPGKAPRPAALEAVVAELEALVDKPRGIEVIISENLEARDKSYAWGRDEMYAYGEQTWDLEVDDKTIKMHAMYVGGKFSESLSSGGGTVGGWAWGGKHTMIFADEVDRMCSNAARIGLRKEKTCELFERALLLHELGHILGLVNAGVPLLKDHQDEDHGHHDDSKDCIMYWSYGGEGILDILSSSLTGGGSPTFGPNCRAEMEAVRTGE